MSQPGVGAMLHHPGTGNNGALDARREAMSNHNAKLARALETLALKPIYSFARGQATGEAVVKPRLVDGMRNPVSLGGFIHADWVEDRIDKMRWPLTFRPYYRTPPPPGVDPWMHMELEFMP